MDTSMIVAIVGGAVLVWAYLTYAKLIRMRNDVKEALSGIDVQFQKRADLIPNMMKMAAKFMEHERGLLTEIVELRNEVIKDYNKNSSSTVKDHIDLENKLKSRMDAFKINVENYPDLKSDQTMINAMNSLEEVEANISAARRFYNAAVNDLNNMVEIFPSSFIASLIKVEGMPFFEAEEAAKKAVNADDYFK